MRAMSARAACRVLLAGLIAASPACFAHYLWLERDGITARLYFGEVTEIREQSPGRLDEIPAPRALQVVTSGAVRELEVQRERGAFAIEGAAAEPQLLAIETGGVVQDWTRYGIGIAKPMFYARQSAWPVREPVTSHGAMSLDVQPLPGMTDRVLVTFAGKPLAGAKVVVHAPNGWDQEQRADDRGLAQVSMPWQGQYVLEVVHEERTPGEFQGCRYAQVRHRATLTVSQGSGIDPAGTGSLAPKLPE